MTLTTATPMSLRPLLRWEAPYDDLFPPRREAPKRGWRWWNIAGGLPDAIDTIQINLGGRRFGAALGTHIHHANLIFANRATFPHADAQRVADTLAFAFDTPVAPSHPSHHDCEDAWLKGSRRIFNLLDVGYHKSESDVPQSLAETRAMFVADGLVREFPLHPSLSLRLTLAPPTSLESPLFLYHLGAASTEPASQFLHFWRVLEALTGPKSAGRVASLSLGMRGRVQRIGATSTRDAMARQLNLISVYRRICRPRYKQLLIDHGNDEGIMKWLSQQRHRAAHGADQNPLQLRDNYANTAMIAFMARLCARAAIQATWVGTPL